MPQRVSRLLVLAALLNGAVSAAQEPQAPSAPVEVQEQPLMDITELSLEDLLDLKIESATLTEQSIQVTPSVVSVMSRGFLRGLSSPTLSGALQASPGVSVLGTSFGEQLVAIRGVSTTANILVSLDGQRLNDFYDGDFIEDLPLYGVERLELIRGPGSALYGTNAFSGVVSLFTPKEEQGFEASVYGHLLTHDAWGQGLTAVARGAQVLGDWRLRGFGSFHTTTGPRVQVEQDLSMGLPYSQVPGMAEGFRRLGTLNLAAERRGLLNPDDALEAWGTLLLRERGPFFGPNNVFSPAGSLERSAALSYLEYRTPLPGNFGLKARLSFDRHAARDDIYDEPAGYYRDDNGNLDIDPGELFPEGRRRITSHTGYRAGGRVYLSHELENPGWVTGNSLLLGAEVEHDWLPEFSLLQNHQNGLYVEGPLANHDGLTLAQQGAQRTILAGFLQDQLQVQPGLWLILGLRYDHYSDFGSTLNPRLAAVWKLSDALTAKVMYGRAFRAPTFQELYDSTRVNEAGLPVRANPDLKPETTQTAEAGIDWGLFSFANLRASAFYTQTDNVIDAALTYNVTGADLINYPGKRILGVESEVQLFMDADNYLLAGVTWFNSTQLGGGIPGWEEITDRRFLDTRITDLPELRGNLSVRAKVASQVRVGLGYAYTSESHNNQRFIFESLYRRFERPAFHELNGTVLVALAGDALELALRAERTFGQSVPVRLLQRVYQLPAEKAQVTLGLQARF